MQITFGEQPLLTVAPIYNLNPGGLDVLFAGQILNDGATATSPALGGIGGFGSDIAISFSRPVTSATFDIGELNSLGGAIVTAYTEHGFRVYEEATQVVGGHERIEVKPFNDDERGGVSLIHIDVQDTEDFGVVIDNVDIGRLALDKPPPAIGDPWPLTEVLGNVLSSYAFKYLGNIQGFRPGAIFATGTMGSREDTHYYIFDNTGGTGGTVNVTFEIFDPETPDDVRIFEKRFSPGSHRFTVEEDLVSGNYLGPYQIRIGSIDGVTSTREGTPAEKLTGLFGTIGLSQAQLVAQLQKVANESADAAALKKNMDAWASKFGKAAWFIEVGLRIPKVVAADDWVEELFVQVVDILLLIAAMSGGSIGGPVGTFFAGFGYSVIGSDLIQPRLREIYQSLIDPDEVGPRAMSLSASEEVPLDQLLVDLAEEAGLVLDLVFDEAYYLTENPDVAARIAAGELPSAYAHFVTEGVFEGRLTHAGQTAPLAPEDVVGSDLGQLPPDRLEIFSSLLAPFAGDGLSAPEADLAAEVAALTRVDAVFGAIPVDSHLTAIANRKAWDLVQNSAGIPFAELASEPAFADAFTIGETAETLWADEIPGRNFRNVEYFAVHPEPGADGTPFGALLAQTDIALSLTALFSSYTSALGVGEYGGVWVVAFEAVPLGQSPMTGDVGLHEAFRVGDAGRNIIDLGTWEGTGDGRGGDDLLYSGPAGGTLLGGPGVDTLIGREGADLLIGGPGGDILNGGPGTDSLSYAGSEAGVVLDLAAGTGTGGDAEGDLYFSVERIVGSAHDDRFLASGPDGFAFVGAGGTDTLAYAETRARVDVALAADGTVGIASQSGAADTAADIERVEFADGTLLYDLSFSDAVQQAYRLYQASFARTPDETGLRFWANRADTLGPLRMAEFFRNAPEFEVSYGRDLSDNDYAEILYGNVLQREPDPDGLRFWQSVLADGILDRDGLMVSFADSDENVALTRSDIEDGYWTL